jgi:drug/metabolite transporter (DMT)-like permease
VTDEVSATLKPESALAGRLSLRGDEGRLALAAALVTVVLWASAFVGIRAAGRMLAAGPLALTRLLVGSLALGVLVMIRGERLPVRRDFGGVLICGLLWFGAYNLLLNQAEHMVDAGTASMLVNIGPVFIALLGGLLLGEGFPRRLLIGCAIAFAGTATIGLATSARGLQPGLGAVLCIAAAAAYAGGVTAEKPALVRNSALTVTWMACGIGAIACLPFAPQLARELPRADLGTIVWAIYLGVFPTAIGFSLWAYALARTSSGRLGATTYLVPPVAIAIGWLMLGEAPPGLALLGGVLCLAGVAVTRGMRLPRSKS